MTACVKTPDVAVPDVGEMAGASADGSGRSVYECGHQTSWWGDGWISRKPVRYGAACVYIVQLCVALCCACSRGCTAQGGWRQVSRDDTVDCRLLRLSPRPEAKGILGPPGPPGRWPLDPSRHTPRGQSTVRHRGHVRPGRLAPRLRRHAALPPPIMHDRPTICNDVAGTCAHPEIQSGTAPGPRTGARNARTCLSEPAGIAARHGFINTRVRTWPGPLSCAAVARSG